MPFDFAGDMGVFQLLRQSTSDRTYQLGGRRARKVKLERRVRDILDRDVVENAVFSQMRQRQAGSAWVGTQQNPIFGGEHDDIGDASCLGDS